MANVSLTLWNHSALLDSTQELSDTPQTASQEVYYTCPHSFFPLLPTTQAAEAQDALRLHLPWLFPLLKGCFPHLRHNCYKAILSCRAAIRSEHTLAIRQTLIWASVFVEGSQLLILTFWGEFVFCNLKQNPCKVTMQKTTNSLLEPV